MASSLDSGCRFIFTSSTTTTRRRASHEPPWWPLVDGFGGGGGLTGNAPFEDVKHAAGDGYNLHALPIHQKHAPIGLIALGRAQHVVQQACWGRVG